MTLDNFEEDIDPNKWNQKELLKHVYRELVTLSEKIDNLESKREDQIININREIDLLRSEINIMKGFAKAFGVLAALAGLVLGALEIFIK